MWKILLGVTTESPVILHTLETAPISSGGHMALSIQDGPAPWHNSLNYDRSGQSQSLSGNFETGDRETGLVLLTLSHIHVK